MHADTILRNALLIDGTGAPRRAGDLAIRDDRIAAIGDLSGWAAGVEHDAGGKVLAPGFIDVHVHYDEAVLVNPQLESALSQGVTTVVNGNCGFSIAPLTTDAPLPMPLGAVVNDAFPRFRTYAAYDRFLRDNPASVNAACLIGHSNLRVNMMADLSRPADRAELKAMCAQLDQALAEGGKGLSTGPFYPPARGSDTDELIEVTRVLRNHPGKMYVTHMRDEGDRVIEGLQEAIDIGHATEVPIHISHHKCAGLANHGKSCQTLPMIDAARASLSMGLDTTPYIASSTMLNSGRHKQASRVIVAGSKPYPEMSGRDLEDVAREWGVDLDAAMERLLPAMGVFFIMGEDDVQRILTHDLTLICSDAIAEGNHPHPRVWGTFPRVLGHYARDKGLFPLENAVARMTGMSADRFGLTDRGVLREGAFADLVLFDPETIIDRATYEVPKQTAAGIEKVWVNGRLTWQDGAHTGARAGHTL
ncbi:amidohydrolase family protein [Pararhodobacter sp. CCB-MM2]|uniref:N-acyl-D-amino-acid deacylase family protein n=1 Tax=Pararhodobacter sp. CCB-MM2 TaxID=1786003 RepID=UPI00082BC82B|nr:D-aminoacylase [Pararhodobacter sp. CCB-MM2]